MTNQEINKAVAMVLGWTDIGVEIERGWVGKPPDRLGYHPIPPWLEDLPAGMRDLWPWLKEQFKVGGFSLSWMKDVCEFNGFLIPAHMGGTRIYIRNKTEALAICNAVLAVSKKLKEGSDG